MKYRHSLAYANKHDAPTVKWAVGLGYRRPQWQDNNSALRLRPTFIAMMPRQVIRPAGLAKGSSRHRNAVAVSLFSGSLNAFNWYIPMGLEHPTEETALERKETPCYPIRQWSKGNGVFLMPERAYSRGWYFWPFVAILLPVTQFFACFRLCINYLRKFNKVRK